jgi:hypothetical protein
MVVLVSCVLQKLVLPPRGEWLSDLPLHKILRWNGSKGPARGLVNFGNTCYQNSCLQCLAGTAPLVQYLASGQVRDPVTGLSRAWLTYCARHSPALSFLLYELPLVLLRTPIRCVVSVILPPAFCSTEMSASVQTANSAASATPAPC